MNARRRSPRSSRPRLVLALAAPVAMLLLAAGASARGTEEAGFEPLTPVPIRCTGSAAPEPCLALRNEHIRADVSDLGTFALGTTGGDPDTPADDDTALLYDFRPGGNSDVGSGYPTIRLSRPGAEIAYFFPRYGSEVVHQEEDEDAGTVVTAWRPELEHYRVLITETLRLVDNAFSGRPDALDIRFEVRNEGPEEIESGLRILLDVKMGGNDGAPYFVPGEGTVDHERAWSGDDVPPYWVAFESETFDPSGLRAVGNLGEEGVVRPDEFWIVSWRSIHNSAWDYAVDPNEPVTQDSAVAMRWSPRPLAPGAVTTANTRYGLSSATGGHVFLNAPVELSCGRDFLLSLFVTNFDIAPMTGGSATVELPPGMRLSPGESKVKAIPDIAPNDTASVAWSLRVDPGTQGSRELRVSATFDGGRRYELSETVQVRCAITATPTPATPPPTPTPSPRACDFIAGRVPPAAIAAALANPERVAGWQELVNPGLPPSPANPYRTRLSIRSIAVPYHPLTNSLIWKGGCP